ncbi:nuclear transport factor 2 family protein [Nocardia alni]|uniref:nuclear transport factor 2 family protein n=1 Tax=Nocardia alni TaxID=2815723 RepID=UPI001C21E83B|nr:nuclear transport factor 2 family protein [Nocardia alni]
MPQHDDLQLLLDERAIRRVILRYCRGIDRGDVELVRSCYHPDALDVHGRYRGDAHGFAEHAVTVLTERYEVTSHAVHNCLIEITGDTAHVETYFVAHHESRATDPDRHTYRFGGRYIDRFIRADGQWAISRRVLVRDWSARDPLSSEASAAAEGERATFVNGTRNGSDLAYESAFDQWISTWYDAHTDSDRTNGRS